MRKKLVYPLAGAALLLSGAAMAQSTDTATPPAAPAPASQTPAETPSMPAYDLHPAPTPDAPVPQPAGSTQNAPAYGQQTTGTQSYPAATPQTGAAAAPAPNGPPAQVPAYEPYGIPDEDRKPDHDGSVYIPVDSWIYPEMTRLYSLGYVDTMFLSMRPWTRKSVMHMLEESEGDIRDGGSKEANAILDVLLRELHQESTGDGAYDRGTIYGMESAYTRVMGISGQTLRDSYHLGQTIVNDYGRPYEPGFNAITGVSGLAESGRLSLYVRAEYQHAPGAAGYSQSLSNQLSTLDEIPYSGYNLNQATIPTGPIGSANPLRIVEATLSLHVLGHEISGGKSDAWLGPAQGGAMAWSNNAENIYSFRINRVEPLHIPLLSWLLGPVRYDFFYGSLKGHTYPNSPWVHSEMFAFRPTKNFEFGFQRTIIFGGEGHEPVTLHTFLKGFFDYKDTTNAEKYSRDDPGARYSDFNMSYRLPFVRKYATLYVDSIAHDDVTPISAPRRAAYRTGVYLSQIPGLRRLDFRAEAVTTDPGVARSYAGQFNYFETVQRQGYTNKGFIMGDWIGREAKGGQAWITYHLSGDEWVQLEYLNKKNAKDFIAGGTTQNSFKASVVKRFANDTVELNAWVQHEVWKAPIYLPGAQGNTTTAVQLTFFPKLKSTNGF